MLNDTVLIYVVQNFDFKGILMENRKIEFKRQSIFKEESALYKLCTKTCLFIKNDADIKR